MNTTDLLDRLSYWLVLARRAALKAYLAVVKPDVAYEDGCCSCGGLLATWVYWGAMPGPVSAEPDWAECDRCHYEATSEEFRSLPHMTVTQYRVQVAR